MSRIINVGDVLKMPVKDHHKYPESFRIKPIDRPYVEVDASFSDTHCKLWIPEWNKGALLTNSQFFNVWGKPKNKCQTEESYNAMANLVRNSFGDKN
jgi:hypothetical protein